MARRRRSKKNVVQVTPDATLNYVSGILTGANAYISGLLEGSNEYNSWVQQESALEGKEIGEYKPDSLRKFLEATKSVDPAGYQRLIADPYGYIKDLEVKDPNKAKAFLNSLIDTTNYKRLENTDKYMIQAGKNYRDQIPSLIKSRSMDTGLTFLQNYAPSSAKAMDKINGILKSSINVGY